MAARSWLKYIMIAGCAFACSPCGAQDLHQVVWSFKLTDAAGEWSMLHATASLAAGWHMYSQYLRPGGPLPTRFTFRPNESVYAVIGPTREEGNAVRFYDDLYEMEIVWYGEQVVFRQPLQLIKSHGTISGSVEFMICNEEMCIPGKREFSVAW